MRLIELKPCPFCGGAAELVYAPVNLADKIPCFGVSCKSCKIMIGTVSAGSTDFFRTAHKAVAAWNRRADDVPKP